jgi:ABC-2 type transport system ATP-binding protein
MISVKNLTKKFGDKTAVSDLSFEVKGGEILGFLGPNGAGKTTTMRVLTGFFPPTSGTATVNGIDVCEDPLGVRKLVGYLPEQVPLYKEMTVREFLNFAAEAKRVPSVDRKKAVSKTIERCNLAPVADQLIQTISRGYRQRVGLGQAIVNDPKVLILDEPTVGLDPSQVRDIRNLLRELGKDSTVILSSHILSEVQQMCNRVVIISGGKVQASDTTANLTAAMQGETRISLRIAGTTEEDLRKRLSELDGVRSVESKGDEAFVVLLEQGRGEELAPRVAASVVEAGWLLHELTPIVVNLEDIFIELVEAEKRAENASDPKA